MTKKLDKITKIRIQDGFGTFGVLLLFLLYSIKMFVSL